MKKIALKSALFAGAAVAALTALAIVAFPVAYFVTRGFTA
jgi:hypothetical protein